MLYMETLTIFYHQYTPNVSIYTIHGSYGLGGYPPNSHNMSNYSTSCDPHHDMSGRIFGHIFSIF